MELVFYVPGQPWIIDFAHERGGLVVSQLENQTLQELQVRHPDAKVVSFHEAAAEIHSAHRTQPRAVDREDYEFARSIVLGVVDGSEEEGESFKLEDFGSGPLAQIYAYVEGSYWVFEDVHTLPHAAIVSRVRGAAATA
ncbi:hypothetical protein [Pseudomonas fulva]|uniref:hypothetical protein n=1 Tax=Pseudomonas fulva TaxID=47880 RepID=UPI002DBD8D52|nr:hypothetical protein [Pseudomonas fulva]MEB8059303.1 hypothetical protein [Pseudomonas fulva]